MNQVGVIFDFNGTLFWDSEYQEESWDEYSQSMGVVLSEHEKQQYIHGRNGRDTFEYIFKRNISEEELEILTEEKEIIYRRMCLKNKLEFAPGALSFIEYLLSENIKIAIATASGKSNVNFFMEHFRLLNYFKEEHIIYNDGKTRGKPHPDLFEKAINALQVDKSQSTIFEDSVSGIKAAENAGAGNIIIVNSANGNFEGFPHQVITHFDQVDRNNWKADLPVN